MISGERLARETAALKWNETEPTRWSSRFLTLLSLSSPLEDPLNEKYYRNLGPRLYDEVADRCVDLGISRRRGILFGFGIGLKIVRIYRQNS